jgi:pheromone shutdown protein TraB
MMRKPTFLWIAASLISNSHGLFTLAPPKRSYVEFIEPETGCQVVLLGCLHGSASSAEDVRQLLAIKTDAVVLELCDSRLKQLRREAISPQTDKSELQRYLFMVSKMNEKRGFATASAAAVLGGVSGLQAAMSDSQPGLEFLTALEIAERDQCDLTVADRSVDETLRRMGKLPSISLSMLQNLVKDRNWKDTFGKDAAALCTAVYGDETMDQSHQVRVSSVLTRNRAAVEDLARSTLPPLILSFLIANFASDILALLFPNQAAINPFGVFTDVGLTQQDVLRMTMDGIRELLAQVLPLLAGYVAFALPAARVILCERDEYLTRGIQDACRSESNGKEPRRVVAILGLLHVNGVAKQLLNSKV